MNLALCILMDAFFIALLIQCAVTDIKTRTVSNVSVILLLCLGLAHMALTLLSGIAWWTYPAGLLPAVPFFIAWLKNRMGAGDVKLIMGIGLYLGLTNTLMAFVLMLPVLIICLICSRQKVREVKNTIPFAPVLAFGASGTVLLGYSIAILNL